MANYCEECSTEIASLTRRLCEDCRVIRRRAAKKRWKEKNPEKVKAQALKERDKRLPRMREYVRERYAKEPEVMRERRRAFYAKDPEKHRAKRRQEIAEHPEREAVRRRKYYEKHREEIVAKMVKRRRDSGAAAEGMRRWKKEKEEAPGSFTKAEFAELVESVEGRCVYCWEQPEVLTQDHIVPLSRGGSDYITNIVPACRSCNASKGARTPEEWFGG
jgi:5-methylcytosine-specific restriction endonuclease McrA